MRYFSLLAMATAIALTAGLVAVFGGQQERDHPQPVVYVETSVPDDLSTSTTVVVLHAIFVGPDPIEEEIIARTALEAAIESTTTTTTTTTIPAPADPTPTTAPKGSNPPGTAPSQPAPTTTVSPTTTAPATSAGFRSDYESGFHSKINSLRAARGLPSLTREGSLNSYARDWAKRIADAGGLSHSNLSSLLPPWSAAGENVGKGGSVALVFNALVDSGGHLSNMVADFTHVGIGVWVDSAGVLWTTHVFTR